MEKLQAVNLIMDELGTHHVSSLENTHPDVRTALIQIDNEIRTLLTRGWWFNTLEKVTVPVQSNGYVIVDEGVLVAITDDKYLVRRGQYMWDLKRNSRTFDAPIAMEQYVALGWDALPHNAQQAVAHAAAAAVVRIKLSDMVRSNMLYQLAQSYSAALEDDEIRITSPNMFVPDRIAVVRSKLRRRY